MKRALVLLALTSAGPVMAEGYAWEGIWAADPAWCQWADQIGRRNPAPVRLTVQAFDGYENGCDVQKIIPLEGDLGSGWMITSLCTGETEGYLQSELLFMAGPDKLWRWFGVSDPVPFYRCGEM